MCEAIIRFPCHTVTAAWGSKRFPLFLLVLGPGLLLFRRMRGATAGASPKLISGAVGSGVSFSTNSQIISPLSSPRLTVGSFLKSFAIAAATAFASVASMANNSRSLVVVMGIW